MGYRGKLEERARLDLDAAEAHWSEVTGVPRQRFTKPYRAVAAPTRRRTKHVLGCATVSYPCTRTTGR